MSFNLNLILVKQSKQPFIYHMMVYLPFIYHMMVYLTLNLVSHHWSSLWSLPSWQWRWQSGWRLTLQSISLVLRWSLPPLKLGSIGPRPHWQHWQSKALTNGTCMCTSQSILKMSFPKFVLFVSNFLKHLNYTIYLKNIIRQLYFLNF